MNAPELSDQCRTRDRTRLSVIRRQFCPCPYEACKILSQTTAGSVGRKDSVSDAGEYSGLEWLEGPVARASPCALVESGMSHLSSAQDLKVPLFDGV